MNERELMQEANWSQGYLDPGVGRLADDPKVKQTYNSMVSDYNRAIQGSVDDIQTAFNNVGGAVSRGSGLSGNSGYLSIQRPYLVMSIPNISLPENYGHYYGYPCNITETLGNLTGFTKVADVHLDGFTCTKRELDEIERLLKEGVIL